MTTKSEKLDELEKLFYFEANKRFTNSIDEIWSKEVRRSIIFESMRIKNANVPEDYNFDNWQWHDSMYLPASVVLQNFKNKQLKYKS